MKPQELLIKLFQTAVASAQAETCLAPFLPPKPKGQTVVIGAGKASAAMALAFENHWQGDFSGVVVTRYGYKVDCQKIQILQAAHPIPDQNSLIACQKIFKAIESLTSDDLVIALISGGGSALLSHPIEGLSLDEKIQINKALLNSGAPIKAINCVRKHLSAIKGGQLAQRIDKAKLITFCISDIPGDDPSLIASGPTIIDHSSPSDALSIINQYRIDLKPHIIDLLKSKQRQWSPPKAHSNTQTVHIIAKPMMALNAAKKLAEQQGLNVMILSDQLEGEAAAVAKQHAELALNTEKNTLILSGGELTVTHSGTGKGGPNTEYALALAFHLKGAKGIYAIACDTDGIDGSEDNAGAIINPDTFTMANTNHLDFEDYLSTHNSYVFFKQLNALVNSGPTYTNVNDFRAILVE